MNRKMMIIGLCVATIATSTLAIGLKPTTEALGTILAPQPAAATTSNERASALRTSASLISPQTDGRKAESPHEQVPQYVIYRQLFRHIVTLKKKAGEDERNGRDGAPLRSLYKRNAKLNDAEAAILEQIAEESDRQISELDAQAQKIIAEARAQHPGGELSPGETLPPPPAELGALQEFRNNAVLQARDRLRALFGEEAFARFDSFVQRDIAPNIKPVRLGIPRPAMPNSPRQQKEK